MPQHDPTVYRLTLGKVVAILRKEAEISQDAFAAAIGVSQPTLSRIERGDAIPDVQTFIRIAQSLGLTPTDLHAIVDDAIEKATRAASSASNEPSNEALWGSILKIAGIVGLAGLVAFAVASALNERDERGGSPRRRRR